MGDRRGPGRSERIALVLSMTGSGIWGLDFLFAKVGQSVATPTIYLSHRFLAALIGTVVVMLLRQEKISLKGKNKWALLYLGVNEPLYFFLATYSVRYSNATMAGVMTALSPLFAIPLSMLFLKEYPSKKQMLFTFLPIAGVILTTITGNSLGVLTPLGFLFLMGTNLSLGIYRTVNRAAAADYSALVRTFTFNIFGATCFTAIALARCGTMANFVAPLADWKYVVVVLGSGVLCSVFANELVNYSAGKISVTKISATGTMLPVVAAVAGVLSGEPMSFMLVVGIVLILFGVWQVSRIADLPAEATDSAVTGEESGAAVTESGTESGDDKALNS